MKTKFEASRVKVNINNTRVNDGPHGKLNFYIEKVCRVARLSFQDDIYIIPLAFAFTIYTITPIFKSKG